jgi:hypothetical protein
LVVGIFIGIDTDALMACERHTIQERAGSSPNCDVTVNIVSMLSFCFARTNAFLSLKSRAISQPRVKRVCSFLFRVRFLISQVLSVVLGILAQIIFTAELLIKVAAQLPKPMR